jgi:UDP-N-acetyl-D-mannosaminuronic acid dehydrogenase
VFETVGVVGTGRVGLTLTAALARKGFTVYGADVSPGVEESLVRGRPRIVEPGVEEAFADSDGVLVLNDHPDYRAIRVESVLAANPPTVIYDAWGILDEYALPAAGVRYAGLGYVANPPTLHPGPAA